ncbi:MAG: hypothetical protein M0Q42_11680 [Xanthomonadales bacterium]|nr:hypothetical protein [Xanthomonadales bacterium]
MHQYRPALIAGLLAMLALLVSLPLAAEKADQNSADAGHQQAWWTSLQNLCGQAFAGQLVRAPADDATFRDREVRMHLRHCDSHQVRIALVIDDDRSRTWIFSRDDDGIAFAHDHRQPDGTPEAVSDYGGRTVNAGSADSQMFPADDHTRRVIAGSGLRSVWLVEIHPGQRFVYAANRVGTERGFQVDFDLSQPVPSPPAPWGWPEPDPS